MPRRARIHFSSLRSCLVNLPLSLYGGLVQGNVRPQGLGVHLKPINLSSGTLKDGILLGWTGLASSNSFSSFSRSAGASSSEVRETIDVDPQLAQILGTGFNEGDIVEVGLIHDLPVAKTVNTEPISEDDWEILELHASYVESNLLGQVRCVSVNQEICVWVLGRTLIRMRVVSTEPPGVARGSLLSNDTEVVIAPRTRKLLKDVLDDNAPSAKASPFEGSPRDTEDYMILRALPSEFFQPVLAPDLPYQEVNASKKNSNDVANKPLNSVIAFTSLRSFVYITTSKDGCPKWNRDTRLIAPIDLTRKISPLEARSEQERKPTQEPRLLHRSESEKKDAELPEVMQAILMPTSLVSDLDIAILIPVSSMGSCIKSWDLAKCEYVPTRQTAVSSERFYRLFPSALAFTYSPVGVPKLMNDAQAYLRQTLYLNMGLANGLGHIDSFGSALLHGRKGYGKTLIARGLAERLSREKKWYTRPLYIDLATPEFASLGPLKLKSRLQEIIDDAAWNKPSTIILDNLHTVCPPEEEHQPSRQVRQKAFLMATLLAPSTKDPLIRRTSPNGILIIATTESIEALHPLLMQRHVFGHVVDLAQYNQEARKEVIEHYVQRRAAKHYISLSSDDPVNYKGLAGITEGYSPSDLIDLVGRSVHTAAIRQSKESLLSLSMRDFLDAQKGFIPLALRGIPLTKGEVAWSDIGGLNNVKRILRETLEWPTKYAAIFQRAPLRLRSGLLLFGYPGCGKTLLASAVAKECGLHFITIKGPELLNKYIGASEQSIRDLFARANAAKPCVLFFDEFDSIAPRRGHDSTGVTDRVVNQLLTQMDGAEGLDGVYVLAATSRPDLIDPALLRPGRLDKLLLCNMPDLEDRKQILQALNKKVPVENLEDLDDIAEATEGYSGADLQAVLYNAHLAGIHAYIELEKAKLRELKGSNQSNENADLPNFVELGGLDSVPKSLAEKEALRKRIKTIIEAPTRSEEEENRYKASNRSGGTEKVVLESQGRSAGADYAKRMVTRDQLFTAVQNTRPSVPKEEFLRLHTIYQEFQSGREGKLQKPPDSTEVGVRLSMA